MTILKRISINALVLNAMMVCAMVAQDYNLPLTMEGLNHTINTSALSKSLGGITIPIQKDVSLMFVNPTGLSTLDALTISVGAVQIYTGANQTQTWQPSTYYGNYTLLMDGSLAGISHSVNPDTLLAIMTRKGVKAFPGDTLWIPYDNIGPNWSHTKSNFVPNIFVAMPFEVSGMKAAAGLGYSEYANMNYFYQNNNSLNPNPNELMSGQGVVKGDSTRRVNWWQSIRSREGILHSIGGAFSIDIAENFSAGLSAQYITGDIDDNDQTLGRGVIWFMASGANPNKVTINSIRLDSVNYRSSVVGTSSFTGYDANISAVYRGKNVTVGIVIMPPYMTITRKFSGQTTSYAGKTADYAASPLRTVDTSFTQKMSLPIRTKIGLGFQVRPNVLIAAEYEYDPYSAAELERPGFMTTKPWLDASSFHLGIKWEPVENYSLRFGYRRQSDVFQAQYSAFDNQPVSYIAYSAGIGIHLMKGLDLDAAYEFYEQKYEDTWVDNNNINILNSNTISLGLQYTLQ